VSGRRGDKDSPHQGGQAVARAARTQRSMWPKPSPSTPVRRTEDEVFRVPGTGPETITKSGADAVAVVLCVLQRRVSLLLGHENREVLTIHNTQRV